MGRWRYEVGYGTHAAMPTRTDAHNISTATDGDMHLVGVAILAGVRAGTRLRSPYASAALFVLLIIVCDLYTRMSPAHVVVELLAIINFSVGKVQLYMSWTVLYLWYRCCTQLCTLP